MKWDGLIYNPRGREENAPEGKDTKDPATKIRGQFEPIAEGQYFYKFKYRLTKDYPWQVSYIPVKIDNTAPKIVSIDFSNPEKIKLITRILITRSKSNTRMKLYLGEIRKNILKNLTRLPTKFGMQEPLLLMKMERLRKILK